MTGAAGSAVADSAVETSVSCGGAGAGSPSSVRARERTGGSAAADGCPAAGGGVLGADDAALRSSVSSCTRRGAGRSAETSVFTSGFGISVRARVASCGGALGVELSLSTEGFVEGGDTAIGAPEGSSREGLEAVKRESKRPTRPVRGGSGVGEGGAEASAVGVVDAVGMEGAPVTSVCVACGTLSGATVIAVSTG